MKIINQLNLKFHSHSFMSTREFQSPQRFHNLLIPLVSLDLCERHAIPLSLPPPLSHSAPLLPLVPAAACLSRRSGHQTRRRWKWRNAGAARQVSCTVHVGLAENEVYTNGGVCTGLRCRCISHLHYANHIFFPIRPKSAEKSMY